MLPNYTCIAWLDPLFLNFMRTWCVLTSVVGWLRKQNKLKSYVQMNKKKIKYNATIFRNFCSASTLCQLAHIFTAKHAWVIRLRLHIQSLNLIAFTLGTGDTTLNYKFHALCILVAGVFSNAGQYYWARAETWWH